MTETLNDRRLLEAVDRIVQAQVRIADAVEEIIGQYGSRPALAPKPPRHLTAVPTIPARW